MRKKGRKARRGFHDEVKLHGLASWTRHVYDQDGNPQTVRIMCPQDVMSTRFVVSVTEGFFESLDEKGLVNE